ncbi:plasma kallikrein-like [Teleopsis dalmanni]|uniref:plasma kallikrein-like n=1 Tax=Teleopsis dalmanni TaxID=139649 RepID=UPI0018CE9DAD|nr:plasma kallikrein-like [Teleopsis dalmanni]
MDLNCSALFYIREATIGCILVHEGYSPTLAIHDIALLELSTILEFNEYVKAVILPTMYQNVEEASNVELIGWGLNETFGTLQSILQKVELELVTLANCRRELNAFLQESNLCAADVGQKKGQCSGDSGGPLLYNHNIQIGIVSWSLKPCAMKPGVFTSVKNYLSWIYETIN